MDPIDEERTGDFTGEQAQALSTNDSNTDNGPRPKTYILHRTEGKGRSHPIPATGSDEDRKPPCFVCYVPPPVYMLARFFEQNFICEAFGRIGCIKNDSYLNREKILVFGLVANILSLILSMVACFSLSNTFDHIVTAGFSKGIIYIPEVDIPTSRIWIGLRAVAIRNFEGQALIERDFVRGDQVINFDEFCDYVDLGLERYMDPNDCDSCAEASGGLMTAVLMATLTTLPNIFTDVLRMYPNYDLNCQKFFGVVMNLVSAASSLYAYRGYANECFRAFYDENEVPLADFANSTFIDNLSELNPDFSFNERTIRLAFLWRPGNGLACIVLATFLKAFDVIAMLLIPAPDIAHTKSLQEEYEELYGEDKDSCLPESDDDEIVET